MKNISFQKGSIGLVVLVIVLLMVILSGVAWYYMKSQNANLKSQNDNAKSKVGEAEEISVIPPEAEESLSGETLDNDKLYKVAYKNSGTDFNFQFVKASDVLIAGEYTGAGASAINLELFKKDDVFDYSPLSTKVQVIQNLISPSTIEELKKSVKSDLDNTNIIDVTIAGNPGISYIIGGICHGKATKFVKDKYEVTVSEYCTTRTSDYDQILSTFKFNE
ncbi:hypothetical protein CO101_00525 [Candidatus Berkelbacteria bacterium CG_4_9_14_3_um_filter_39_23]|uniref:Uncharacterized protein n=3 Tax=Bacteria candidate phyla TaxID=1783234 RepID=A0A2M7CI85_9BACT|nr:MAG: hypothetical protein COV39_03530 [Candidatus Berkelbacteria bacterium CG11_big_fil_rev_8_21_14_0_20_40_23]PIV25347.1 MAG: hypothetical protein COS38_02030 [Candidatus Berkelbacteria bacterium CG03_land_8_20_14_0_80_40_36]PIZ28841.1 MAG: hypothetical protein COY44_02055 [Candidatus Berkelbacteria bacterium CG_4_10_14_0_8_um_filter_39_42]PJB51865.1 MAG: hypothetical protein CO101_00525 [Candidatus Berkelbacteria bacterium CG_4_9_14_3_um_filter_39_23]